MPAEPKPRTIERRRGAFPKSKKISWSVSLAKNLTLREVGPQDGLVHEPVVFPVLTKLQLIRSLVDAGQGQVVATGFLDPVLFPQVADADEVARQLPRRSDVVFSARVGEMRGVERAIATGIDEIVTGVGAAEKTEEMLGRVREIAILARRHGIPVRGSISSAFLGPDGEKTDPKRVADCASRLLDLGCTEITVEDETGKATPKRVWKLFDRLLKKVPAYLLAAHFHDTYGMAVSNVLAAMGSEIRTFESSIGGLGRGNVATEDLVFVLEGMGIRTNLSLEKLLQTSARIERFLPHPIASRVYQAERGPR